MNNENSRAQVGKCETRGLGCCSFRQLKVPACRCDLRKGRGRGRGRRPREGSSLGVLMVSSGHAEMPNCGFLV